MTPFAIAGVQMHVIYDRENISMMKAKVHHLMGTFPWVQMVVFSELAAYGPLRRNHPASLEAAEREFKNLARHHGIWLIPGSMFCAHEGRWHNMACVINPEGEIIGRYHKMFPFAPYEQGIEGGTEFLVFDVPGAGRFGLSICYDMWFPETTRTLTAMGAEVLLCPVLTTTVDRDVELSMARATAAMFQCYVFDINGLGAGGCGQSCVVGPSGTVLFQAKGQEQLIPLEIDFDSVRRQRAVGTLGLGQTLKSFRDRRVDFSVYDRERFDTGYLHGLGKLELPARGSRAGLADVKNTD